MIWHPSVVEKGTLFDRCLRASPAILKKILVSDPSSAQISIVYLLTRPCVLPAPIPHEINTKSSSGSLIRARQCTRTQSSAQPNRHACVLISFQPSLRQNRGRTTSLFPRTFRHPKSHRIGLNSHQHTHKRTNAQKISQSDAWITSTIRPSFLSFLLIHYSTNWKMRELITFAVGQAGNQISSAFWQSILNEHGLDEDGVSSTRRSFLI